MPELKKPPTPEEIRAMTLDELEELVTDVMDDARTPVERAPLCPVSGMGREIAEWDECAGKDCAWYCGYTDVVGGEHGCCAMKAVPE